ncbi:MAG: OmpA family protein [Myxococcales bacterium]|nr:OmpA family protein [Myxococcales bacterium]
MLIPLTAALAQTFDASGPAVPPDGASAADPLTTFGGRPVGDGAVTVLAEGAYATLVREVRDGPYVRVDPVVESLFGMNLAGTFGVTRRLGLGATLPLWLGTTTEVGSGAALGDMRIWAPYSLTHEPGDHGISVVPWIRLPTGADARHLGNPFGIGVLASVAKRAGPLLATSDIGLEGGPGTRSPDWRGGLTGSFAGTVGVVSDSIGVHAELRAWAPLGRALLTAPSEGLLTLKGSPADRLWLTLSGGTALTRGPGAAAPRFFAGVTWSFAPPEVEEEAIASVTLGETRELVVLDVRRFPIPDVLVTVGRHEVTTSPEGFADVPLNAAERGGMRLEHPAYITVDRSDLDPEARYWEVVMVRRPVEVAVSVVGPDGEPMLTGTVELRSTATPALDAPKARIDEVGVHHWELPPGSDWVAVLEADRMGGQARVIRIPPERTESIRVDAVLDWAVDPTTHLTVKVVDGVGEAVEDAAVAVEDRDFGTTGPGGELEIGGLPRGGHEVTVRSPLYGDAVVRDVQVSDASEVVVTLDWPAGAVVARVTDVRGQPLDAIVRFAGPAALPERNVGSDGVELLVLRPGEWTLTLEREGLASQERRVSVDDTPGVLREVVVSLVPVPPGAADVVVRATDSAGEALAGVEVTLDGAVVGLTGDDGQLTLLDLEVGERELKVGGELMVPTTRKVDLVDGRQVVEVPVAFVPGVVDLRTEVDGKPVDVEVVAMGDRDVPPVHTGADGKERIVLQPGTWTLKATAPDGTVREQVVTVAGEDRPREVLFQVLDGPGKVAVTVRDTSGAPVPDAVVRVGDADVGRTDAQGRIEVPGVDSGKIPVVVSAPGLPERRVEVQVPKGSTAPVPVEVVMAEPSAEVDVQVSGPDGPVAASIRVRSAEGTVLSRDTEDGEAALELDAGTYHAIVEAPGMAPKEVVLEVDAEGRAEPVAVQLVPAAESRDVVIAVEDVEGVPLANAPVLVDGNIVGRTSEAGTLTVKDVSPRALIKVAPEEDGVEAVEVPASAASGGTFVAQDAARPVQVWVFDSSAGRADAVVKVTGSGQTATTMFDGAGRLNLTPGTWVVTTEVDGRVAAATVTVPRRGEAPKVELHVQEIKTKIVDGKLELVRPILFDIDSSTLRPEAKEVLDDVARLLAVERRAAVVEVAGHTDDVGGVVYNQGLSERRAEAVMKALIARGVEPERLIRRGYGLSRPLAAGEAGRDRNRRVELVVREAAE